MGTSLTRKRRTRACSSRSPRSRARRRVYSSRSLAFSAGSRRSRSRSAAIRFAELLPLYSEFLCVEGAACNGPETPALLFFHYPSVFSNGPTKRPRVLERLSVAQLQGGVPNLGGFRVFVSCTFCWQ